MSHTTADSLVYLADYTGEGLGYFLGRDGAHLLAAHLRSADLPATAADWAGGFWGIDLYTTPDTPQAVCIGYDADDTNAAPGHAWVVFTADENGDLSDVMLSGATLGLAVALAATLL